jgi:hypothetical protein
MGRAGFTGVEASHGIIVRCREVIFGKGCREGGGGFPGSEMRRWGAQHGSSTARRSTVTPRSS